jgi:hypothetical protein
VPVLAGRQRKGEILADSRVEKGSIVRSMRSARSVGFCSQPEEEVDKDFETSPDSRIPHNIYDNQSTDPRPNNTTRQYHMICAQAARGFWALCKAAGFFEFI